MWYGCPYWWEKNPPKIPVTGAKSRGKHMCSTSKLDDHVLSCSYCEISSLFALSPCLLLLAFEISLTLDVVQCSQVTGLWFVLGILELQRIKSYFICLCYIFSWYFLYTWIQLPNGLNLLEEKGNGKTVDTGRAWQKKYCQEHLHSVAPSHKTNVESNGHLNNGTPCNIKNVEPNGAKDWIFLYSFSFTTPLSLICCKEALKLDENLLLHNAMTVDSFSIMLIIELVLSSHRFDDGVLVYSGNFVNENCAINKLILPRCVNGFNVNH